jgi:very-short-patch-repair endonuclease
LVFPSRHRFKGYEIQATGDNRKIHCGFVSFHRHLIVEVNGGQHADSETDERHTRWLEGQGFRVLRFWNNEVLNNTGGVLEAIMAAASTNPSPGTPLRGAPPSPTRGEGKDDSES